MKNLCGIYSITNILNKKVYIGQSRNILKRWKDHARNGNNSKISNAIFKYGVNNFEFKVLEYCKENELNDKEIFYIDKFNSVKLGYNIRQGGNCGKLNTSTKLLISKTQKLRYEKRLQKHFVTFSGGKQKAPPLNIIPKQIGKGYIAFSDYQKRRIFSHMFTPTYNDNQINPELWDINGFDKNMTIQALL